MTLYNVFLVEKLKKFMEWKLRAKNLKRDIPAVFLALKHKETPIGAKLLAGLTIGYALSPIDLIPDFIPVLGHLDDLILLPALITLTIRLIPEAVLEQCREESEHLWENGKPKKWYCGIPIAAIWLGIAWLVLRAIL